MPAPVAIRSSVHLAGLLALCLLAPAAAWALATDRDQPVEVEADYAEMDDVAGTTVYKGNVVVVQGSIRVTGDVLTVNYTPEREMKEVLVDGKPATFRQRPDGKTEDVEGEGIRVEYFVLQDLVYLKREAKLREAGKRMSGNEIIYDTARSVVTARKAPDAGGPAGPDKTGKPRERVRVILPPRQPAAGGAAAAPAPARP
jgi:lipopolysaccharide export system protein LptA